MADDTCNQVHNLWTGGGTGPFHAPYGKEFPSQPLDPEYPYRPAGEFDSKLFTYGFEFNTCKPKVYCTLQEYLKHKPICENDCLHLVVAPRRYNFVSMYWELLEPLPGVTGELDLCGLDGTVMAGPVPWDLGQDLSAPWTPNHDCSVGPNPGVPDPACIDGYLNQHHILRLKILTLPPEMETICDPCFKECFAFTVSLTVADNCNKRRAKAPVLPCPVPV